MVEPIGTQLFWMITIGLVIGFAGYYLFGKRGVKLIPSILMSVLGAVVAGMAGYIFNFEATLAFAVIGAMAFLFITNAFLQKDKEAKVKRDRPNSS